MKTNSGRNLVRAEVLAEIDALPDRALVFVTRSSRDDWFYSSVAIAEPYVSDPDFSSSGLTKAEAVAACARKIREDLRGVGKYAPHWSSYDVEYRVLPHWRSRA